MSGHLHIFSGSDDFSVKESVASFMHGLCKGPPQDDPSVEIIDGDSDSESAVEILDAFINSLSTPPFLTPEKILWLRHFDKFEDAFAEKVPKGRKTRLDVISDMFKEGVMDGVTVVIDGSGIDKKRVFYKTCSAVCSEEGNSLEWFDKIDVKSKNFESEMARRARDIAAKEGKKLTAEASDFLARTTSGDLLKLKNEILKLTAYSGANETVSLADCTEVCSATTETIAWEFSSALTARDAKKALGLIPSILSTLSQGSSSGNPELAVIAGAANEFKRLLSLKCEGIRCGIPEHASANDFYSYSDECKEAGIKNAISALHPFRAFKMWQAASRFRDEEFADVFEALFNANRAVVTGSANSRMALEDLVLKIAGPKD